jgi:hypothetical protein
MQRKLFNCFYFSPLMMQVQSFAHQAGALVGKGARRGIFDRVKR